MTTIRRARSGWWRCRRWLCSRWLSAQRRKPRSPTTSCCTPATSRCRCATGSGSQPTSTGRPDGASPPLPGSRSCCSAPRTERRRAGSSSAPGVSSATATSSCDATDGFDTVEWTAALPYTTGDVGMFGTSYGAHTQADAAKMNPPHLKALLLNQGGISDPWLHKVRNHGAFELGQQLGWAFGQLRLSPDPVVRAAFEAEEVADWFAAMPFRRGLSPLAAAPAFEDYVLDQIHARGPRPAGRRRPALDAPRRELERLLRPHRRRPDAARRGLVRPLRRQHVRELRRADAGEDLAHASSGRPLDPRRQRAVVRGGRRVRTRRGVSGLRDRAAPGVARPSPQADRHRGRRLAADPPLRHGHRRWPSRRQRPAGSRRLLAGRLGLAPARGRAHAVLLPRQRHAEPARAGRGAADHLHLRSRAPGADHRRVVLGGC